MAIPVGRKVLLDTNVFIDFLRAELHSDWILGRRENVVRFVSAIVLLELNLGAGTPTRHRSVSRIEAAFRNRIIAPAPRLFSIAGRLFQVLYGTPGEGSDRLGQINDLLIALTAREIGATVVTSNLAEFRRIGEEISGLRVLAPSEHL
ncbi:MAG TPA: type II toxin-antitoxin system VapC family toxin [Nitrospiraceae bacterium]|nr:type II toxin-antitoxin system VapC family toxin [Nitrospiraceae bacterium]